MMKLDDLRKEQVEEREVYSEFKKLFADYLKKEMKPGFAYNTSELLKMFADFSDNPITSKGLTEKVEKYKPFVAALRSKAKQGDSSPTSVICALFDVSIVEQSEKHNFLRNTQLRGETYYYLKD